jgi:hypothetical protein
MHQVRGSSLASNIAWRNLLALLIFLHAFIGLLFLFAPRLTATIPSSIVQPEHGAAYAAPLRYDGGGFLYRLTPDTLSAPAASRLQLIEDGNQLGPAHSLHAAIRNQGAGRFSHWGNSVLFATSDGSDPRHNGRVYAIASPLAVNASWIVGLVVLDIGVLIALRRRIFSILQSRHGTMLLVGVGAVVLAACGLASAGLFGTITLAAAGAPKDPALVLSVVAHAVVGCVVALAFWAAGAGLARLAVRNPHASLASVLLPAFPVALGAAAVLLAVALATPRGRVTATVLWSACLLPLAAWRPPAAEVHRLLKALLAILPCALLFGIWLGLLWHGPSPTLAGSPSGDMAFYAGSMWSMALGPPFIDFTYANGQPLPYFNMLFSTLGAALLPLPGFDPFLFLFAGGGASYILFSALMLHAYVTDRGPAAFDAFAAVVLPTAFVVAARYPSWVVESPPMIFVPALTIAIWWMVEQSRQDLRWAIGASAAALAGTALTKVVTAATLVPLAATGFWRRFERSGPSTKIAILAVACAIGAYCVVMLVEFLPYYLKKAEPGPESLVRSQWWFWWRDVGAALLAIVALRAAERPVALAIIGGLVAFLAFSFLLYANFVCAVLVLGLIVSAGAETSTPWRLFTIAAFACALPAALFADPTGAGTGVVWVICLGGAVFLAIAASAPMPGLPDRLRLRHAALVAATALALGGLGLFGVARGHLIVTSGWHPGEPELTPAVRDIWSAVREHTSPQALIFTDQIGDTPPDETPALLRGWNTYVNRGQRQVYLSNYYGPPDLRVDLAKRRQALAINEQVLSGVVAPGQVPTTRNYDSFYAVVARSRIVPTGWQEIYENDRYSLYRIPNPN